MKPANPLFVYGGLAAAALIVVLAVVTNRTAAAASRVERMRSLQRELAADGGKLAAMAQAVADGRQRASSSKTLNLPAEIESVADGLGIRKNLRKVTTTGRKQSGSSNTDIYEVRVENIDLNTAVNFLYRLTRGPMAVAVQRCTVSTAYDNPNLVSISIVVNHITG